MALAREIEGAGNRLLDNCHAGTRDLASELGVEDERSATPRHAPRPATRAYFRLIRKSNRLLNRRAWSAPSHAVLLPSFASPSLAARHLTSHALFVAPVGGNTDRSELHALAHKRLATQLQELAVMDAKMDRKVLVLFAEHNNSTS